MIKKQTKNNPKQKKQGNKQMNKTLTGRTYQAYSLISDDNP